MIRSPRSPGSLVRGIEAVDVEKHECVWKYGFDDVDGNETAIGGRVGAP
jgi:hypothetical protein